MLRRAGKGSRHRGSRAFFFFSGSSWSGGAKVSQGAGSLRRAPEDLKTERHLFPDTHGQIPDGSPGFSIPAIFEVATVPVVTTELSTDYGLTRLPSHQILLNMGHTANGGNAPKSRQPKVCISLAVLGAAQGIRVPVCIQKPSQVGGRPPCFQVPFAQTGECVRRSTLARYEAAADG